MVYRLLHTKYTGLGFLETSPDLRLEWCLLRFAGATGRRSPVGEGKDGRPTLFFT
jgi:hypothetical protein